MDQVNVSFQAATPSVTAYRVISQPLAPELSLCGIVDTGILTGKVSRKATARGKRFGRP